MTSRQRWARRLWLLSFSSFILGWSFIVLGVLSGATSLWRRIRPTTVA